MFTHSFKLRNRQSLLFAILAVLGILLSANASPVFGQDMAQRFKNFQRDVSQKFRLRKAEPKTQSDNAIEKLAHEIDWLENYMDQFGSIVAKHPDVWGESRLTKFRHEIEQQLFEEMSKFELRDNASIRRSDIADLAAALSIGVASLPGDRKSTFSGGDQFGSEIESKTVYPTPDDLKVDPNAKPRNSTTTSQTIKFKTLKNLETKKASTAGSNLEPTIEMDQLNRYLNHLVQLRRINEGDDTSDAPGYALNLVRVPVSVMPGRATRRGYGAEITISATPYKSETLLPTTFRNLVINDLIDQLSLPVLKIAEIEGLELVHFLSDPENNRLQSQLDLQIRLLDKIEKADVKDLIRLINEAGRLQPNGVLQSDQELDLVAFAVLARFVDGLKKTLANMGKKDLNKKLTEIVAYFKFVFRKKISQAAGMDPSLRKWLLVSTEEEKLFVGFEKEAEENRDRYVERFVKAAKNAVTEKDAKKAKQFREQFAELNNILVKATERHRFEIVAIANDEDPKKTLGGYYRDIQNFAMAELQAKRLKDQKLVLTTLRTSVENAVVRNFGSGTMGSTRNSHLRVTTAPILAQNVFGTPSLREMAAALKFNYRGRNVVWNESSDYKNQIHLLDARRFLQANMSAAYGVLASDRDSIRHDGSVVRVDLTDAARTPRELLKHAIENCLGLSPSGLNLAETIQRGDTETVEAVRKSFIQQLKDMRTENKLAHFCWCVVVQMAVLNKQLNQDAHEAVITKGNCRCHPTRNFMYYLPMPADHESLQRDFEFREAAAQFCEYVNCRWPIQVFTIDPVNQEQNVSDASVVRRELAIAAALSFAQGKISLSQLTSFQRQFQEDISTVALNRTQVGFVHRNDTFGWKFSPRVQTRAPQGNIKAFNETLYGRRADANIREAVLEPGMRECTAIILMPSFIPYCDFDVRANWYQLDRPTHSDVSMKQTMKLSRAVTSMRNTKQACIQCASLYRDGETDRLLRRVEQLERELPLQTLRFQVPFENTLGGSELFNNGLTDLAPKLVGWYGAPGIRIKGNEPIDPKITAPPENLPTTVFLVGDNFSVHETKFIAGGSPIEKPKLISRQVVQVEIPNNVKTVDIGGKKYVAVYAATPYGTTSHLHLPIVVDGKLKDYKKELEELAKLKKRIAVLEEAEFSWSSKPDLNIEIGFGVDDECCKIGCIQSGNGNHPYKIIKSDISRRQFDKNMFAVIARAKDSKGKVIGQSFKLFDSRKMTAAQKTAKSASTDTSVILLDDPQHDDLKDFIEKNLPSTKFAKENTISLTVETFIAFVEGGNYSTPIRISGDIKLTVTVTEACATKCVPKTPAAAAPATGGTTAGGATTTTPKK